MSERIDELKYEEPKRESTMTPLESNLFITQPVEFLITTFVEELKKDPSWQKLFGDYIYDYERMDISIRTLPAIRVYFDRYKKDFESWFINGDMIIDIIWPPAIRREELNRLPSTVAGAMLQQLRRPEFFQTMGEKIPALDELGKTVNVDFDLGFKWQDGIIPLTRITANFRIDLRTWDEYLTEDYRTKDKPFERTLEDLTRIVTTIEALRSDDPEAIEVVLGINQNL